MTLGLLIDLKMRISN